MIACPLQSPNAQASSGSRRLACRLPDLRNAESPAAISAIAPDRLAISFSRDGWRRTCSSAKASTWRSSPTTRDNGAAMTERASIAEASAASTAPMARPRIRRRSVVSTGSLGYGHANEASWSQLVQSVERMVDRTELPVLVDGDEGFAILPMLASSHANFIGLARRASRLRTAASRS